MLADVWSLIVSSKAALQANFVRILQRGIGDSEAAIARRPIKNVDDRSIPVRQSLNRSGALLDVDFQMAFALFATAYEG